jgi:hypothetical protein
VTGARVAAPIPLNSFLLAPQLLPARAARAVEDQIRRWRALVGPVAGTAVYMLGSLGAA